MRNFSLLICLFSVTITVVGQSLEFDYFGASSPGDKLELFAYDIVSFAKYKENSLAASPIGDEVFFAVGSSWPECKIMHIKKTKNKWTEPIIAEFSIDCYTTEPAFSPDGKYLYFSSSKGKEDIKQYSIWRVEKVGDSWSFPKKIIDIEDPNILEFHPTVTKDGTIYFCHWDSNKQVGSIYKSKCLDDKYSEPEKVKIPFNIQSSDADPFIDPDENFIITSSTGQGGFGGYDVYISYRGENGLWLSPINFGDIINTEGDENSFDISPNGRFVFIYKQDDVYWMEAKVLFESIKK